jgi:adenine-specific DNA-methyltransferase
MATARLISKSQAGFSKLGGYDNAIDVLNASLPVKGFIWREYSPASLAVCGVERRYFTEENAARIDGARKMIADWQSIGLISANEERVLISDLLGAVNRCANIAGTYGCFLSKWTTQSKSQFRLSAREMKSNANSVEICIGNVNDLYVGNEDVVYMDPPYTKRQYAAYYHLLETVAYGDEPIVEGVAGIRPWQDRASDFCYKSRALKALTTLIAGMPARKILLSYSNEGHIDIADLKPVLSKIGNVSLMELQKIGRYRPNKEAGAANSEVKEYLVVIEKAAPQIIQPKPEGGILV